MTTTELPTTPKAKPADAGIYVLNRSGWWGPYEMGDLLELVDPDATEEVYRVLSSGLAVAHGKLGDVQAKDGDPLRSWGGRRGDQMVQVSWDASGTCWRVSHWNTVRAGAADAWSTTTEFESTVERLKAEGYEGR